MQQERKQAITTTLGCRSNEFLLKVNPEAGYKFARNVRAALTRDYPTLTEIDMAYGDGTADNWLVAQIADLALFTGAKNLDKYQQLQTARLISSQYYFLKITELLVFFQWMKGGKYGRFYGSVDPMQITATLRDFICDRNDLLYQYEEEERKRKQEDYDREHPPISREEWEKIKEQRAEKSGR